MLSTIERVAEGDLQEINQELTEDRQSYLGGVAGKYNVIYNYGDINDGHNNLAAYNTNITQTKDAATNNNTVYAGGVIGAINSPWYFLVFAPIIVEEAHSSQTGESAKKLKIALTDTTKILEEYAKMENEEESNRQDDEDNMLNEMAAHGRQPNLSFFAFTATPKSKTLQLFGQQNHKK